MPASCALRGVVQPQLVASIQLELAGVGNVHTREHLDQRRLAGAVIAHEGVDLPGGRARSSAPFERAYGTERLDQPTGAQQRGAGAALMCARLQREAVLLNGAEVADTPRRPRRRGIARQLRKGSVQQVAAQSNAAMNASPAPQVSVTRATGTAATLRFRCPSAVAAIAPRSPSVTTAQATSARDQLAGRAGRVVPVERSLVRHQRDLDPVQVLRNRVGR